MARERIAGKFSPGDVVEDKDGGMHSVRFTFRSERTGLPVVAVSAGTAGLREQEGTFGEDALTLARGASPGSGQD